jgi:hypothetical protein
LIKPGTFLLAMVSNSLGMIPLDSLNLRLLWPKLPTLTRLYAVILCGGSLYVVYALSRTVGKLWTLRRTSEQGSTSDRLSQVFSALCARLDNVRQVIILLWLLFGASFLLELALSPQTADSSRLSLLEIVLIGVLAQAGFGCLVFLDLLLLHVAQWVVSVWLQSFASKHQPT